MKSGTLACVRCVSLHNIYLCKCQPYKMVKHSNDSSATTEKTELEKVMESTASINTKCL